MVSALACSIPSSQLFPKNIMVLHFSTHLLFIAHTVATTSSRKGLVYSPFTFSASKLATSSVTSFPANMEKKSPGEKLCVEASPALVSSSQSCCNHSLLFFSCYNSFFSQSLNFCSAKLELCNCLLFLYVKSIICLKS